MKESKMRIHRSLWMGLIQFVIIAGLFAQEEPAETNPFSEIVEGKLQYNVKIQRDRYERLLKDASNQARSNLPDTAFKLDTNTNRRIVDTDSPAYKIARENFENRAKQLEVAFSKGDSKRREVCNKVYSELETKGLVQSTGSATNHFRSDYDWTFKNEAAARKVVNAFKDKGYVVDDGDLSRPYVHIPELDVNVWVPTGDVGGERQAQAVQHATVDKEVGIAQGELHALTGDQQFVPSREGEILGNARKMTLASMENDYYSEFKAGRKTLQAAGVYRPENNDELTRVMKAIEKREDPEVAMGLFALSEEERQRKVTDLRNQLRTRITDSYQENVRRSMEMEQRAVSVAERFEKMAETESNPETKKTLLDVAKSARDRVEKSRQSNGQTLAIIVQADPKLGAQLAVEKFRAVEHMDTDVNNAKTIRGVDQVEADVDAKKIQATDPLDVDVDTKKTRAVDQVDADVAAEMVKELRTRRQAGEIVEDALPVNPADPVRPKFIKGTVDGLDKSFDVTQRIGGGIDDIQKEIEAAREEGRPVSVGKITYNLATGTGKSMLTAAATKKVPVLGQVMELVTMPKQIAEGFGKHLQSTRDEYYDAYGPGHDFEASMIASWRVFKDVTCIGTADKIIDEVAKEEYEHVASGGDPRYFRYVSEITTRTLGEVSRIKAICDFAAEYEAGVDAAIRESKIAENKFRGAVASNAHMKLYGTAALRREIARIEVSYGEDNERAQQYLKSLKSAYDNQFDGVRDLAKRIRRYSGSTEDPQTAGLYRRLEAEKILNETERLKTELTVLAASQDTTDPFVFERILKRRAALRDKTNELWDLAIEVQDQLGKDNPDFKQLRETLRLQKGFLTRIESIDGKTKPEGFILPERLKKAAEEMARPAWMVIPDDGGANARRFAEQRFREKLLEEMRRREEAGELPEGMTAEQAWEAILIARAEKERGVEHPDDETLGEDEERIDAEDSGTAQYGDEALEDGSVEEMDTEPEGAEKALSDVEIWAARMPAQGFPLDILGPDAEVSVTHYANGTVYKIRVKLGDQSLTKSYWENGFLSEETLKLGDNRITSRSYWEEGPLKRESRTEGDSMTIDSWEVNGTLVGKGLYVRADRDFKLNGVQKSWFANGQRKSELSYRFGDRDGLHSTWDIQGNPISTCTYRRDLLEGEYLSYHSGMDQLRQKILFSAGNPHGRTEEWDTEGETVMVGHYNRGAKDGKWEHWYSENGRQYYKHERWENDELRLMELFSDEVNWPVERIEYWTADKRYLRKQWHDRSKVVETDYERALDWSWQLESNYSPSGQMIRERTTVMWTPDKGGLKTPHLRQSELELVTKSEAQGNRIWNSPLSDEDKAGQLQIWLERRYNERGELDDVLLAPGFGRKFSLARRLFEGENTYPAWDNHIQHYQSLRKRYGKLPPLFSSFNKSRKTRMFNGQTLSLFPAEGKAAIPAGAIGLIDHWIDGHGRARGYRVVYYTTSGMYVGERRLSHDGELRFEVAYQSPSPGKLHKTGWERDWNERGILVNEIHYANGVMDGERKQYDPSSGNLTVSWVLSNGDVREKTIYHKNGQREEQQIFDPKSEEVTYTVWSQDGKIREEGQRFKGQRNGLIKEYDMSGKLYQTTEYNNGVQHGIRIRYDVNTEYKTYEGHFQNGKAHGIVKTFDGATGQLVREMYFLHGDSVSADEFKAGKKIIPETVDLSNGPPSFMGKPYWALQVPPDAEVEDDALSTVYKVNGNVIGKRDWHDEERKVVNIEELYIPGVLKTGVIRYWKTDGGLMHVSYFLNGEKVGPDVFINYEGQLMREQYYIANQSVEKSEYIQEAQKGLLPPPDDWKRL